MVTLMDPNDPQEERVFLALRRLQLPHLRDTLAAVLSEAAKEQWTYLEFLDQILRREVDAKQGKRIRMGLQIAHFPCVRTIEGFDFSLVFCKVVAAGVSAVYLRVAGANNSIVRDARVFLASPWSRRRLTMGPYSMDLRERVAAAIDEGEGSERQIAKRFRVSVSFVTRLLQRVRSRQCQGFPRNPGRFHPGSGLSPSLDQLGAIEREASFL